jgi:hypothetical protein
VSATLFYAEVIPAVGGTAVIDGDEAALAGLVHAHAEIFS